MRLQIVPAVVPQPDGTVVTLFAAMRETINMIRGDSPVPLAPHRNAGM
jgi:hypothetical protein